MPLSPSGGFSGAGLADYGIAVVTDGTFAVLSWRRINPLILISAGGLVYLAATRG